MASSREEENRYSGKLSNDPHADKILAALGKADEKKVRQPIANLVSDEVFARELEHFPMKLQGDQVIVLGPNVEPKTKTGLILNDKDVNEAINKLGGAFRIVAQSPRINLTNAQAGFTEEQMYHPGDYVFFEGNLKSLVELTPKDDSLRYYMTRHLNILFHVGSTRAEELVADQNLPTDESKG